MTDTTHNTLVTLMILVAILLALTLFGRVLPYISTAPYRFQSASAIDATRTPHHPSEYHYDSVTAYSRPSHYVSDSSYSYTSTTITPSYETYGYICTPDYSQCWTHQ